MSTRGKCEHGVKGFCGFCAEKLAGDRDGRCKHGVPKSYYCGFCVTGTEPTPDKGKEANT